MILARPPAMGGLFCFILEYLFRIYADTAQEKKDFSNLVTNLYILRILCERREMLCQ